MSHSSRTAEAFNSRSAPRIFCVGRNYARHIAEFANAADAEECVVFMKPASSLVAPGEAITLPDGIGAIHHEAELVVEIAHGGSRIAADKAHANIGALGLGLDLTLRDIQTELKERGEPWEKAKAFDHSAPMAPLVPLTDDIDLTDIHFELAVDGQVHQSGHTGRMLFGVAELVALISRQWRLLPGDLIFTGTPEGVGPVSPGVRLALSGPQLHAGVWLVA